MGQAHRTCTALARVFVRVVCMQFIDLTQFYSQSSASLACPSVAVVATARAVHTGGPHYYHGSSTSRHIWRILPPGVTCAVYGEYHRRENAHPKEITTKALMSTSCPVNTLKHFNTPPAKINPFRALKPLRTLVTSNFVPKRVSSCRGVKACHRY